MADQHGKDTVIKSGSTDISAFCDASEYTGGADVHDKTTYGNAGHRRRGGLFDGGFKMSGIYDTGASGTPKKLFDGQEGTTFALTRRPEGTGAGKPQHVFNAVLSQYVETSPVADIVRWSTEWQIDGVVDRTPQ